MQGLAVVSGFLVRALAPAAGCPAGARALIPNAPGGAFRALSPSGRFFPPDIPMFRFASLNLLALIACCPALGQETRDLLLVSGQSNAVGYDAYAEDLPADPVDQQTLFWWRVGDPPPDEFDATSGRRWTHLQYQPRTEPMSGEAAQKVGRQYGNLNKKSKGGFGPEMGMVRELMVSSPRRLAVVKVAFSGTSVAGDWNVAFPGKADACYRALIDETRAASEEAKLKEVTLIPKALVWVQGESDANAKDAPVYGENLGRMLDRFRADLAAPELVLLLGVNTRFGNGRNGYLPQVVGAQKEVASSRHRAAYVDTAGAETLEPSHTHFTAAGTLEVGRRFAEALLAMDGVFRSGIEGKAEPGDDQKPAARP